jgi:importin-7
LANLSVHVVVGNKKRKDAPRQLTDVEKAFLRENILQACLVCPDHIQRQLYPVLRKIVYTDYPKHMPNLVEQVLEQLRATTAAGEMCSLLRILSHVMAVFEHCMQGERRLPLHRVIVEAFPTLLQLLQKMNQTEGLESFAVTKEVVRIFHRATSFRISEPLLNNVEVGAQWLTEVAKVISCPLPANQPKDTDLRAEWVPWKARKWTMHVLCCMYERCGDLAKIQKRIERAQKAGDKPQTALFAFSQMWCTHFRHTFIDLCYKLLMTSSQEWYHPRMVQTAMECMALAAKRDADWEILKPQAPILLQKALFPCTCFSVDDRDRWEEDSVDFMRQVRTDAACASCCRWWFVLSRGVADVVC